MVHWGEKLREMVEGLGVPKGEISTKLGITPGALSSTFSSPSVRIDTVFKICEACGAKVWQFIAQIETGILEAVRKLPEARQMAPECARCHDSPRTLGRASL